MWNAVTELLLKLHAQGLGHEAVIEVVIALIGVMIALLGVMLTVAALIIGFVSWFGYAAIKKAAVKQAKKEARKVALESAEDLYRTFLLEEGAAEYSESQKDLSSDEIERDILPEPVTAPEVSVTTPKLKPVRKRPATKDSNLKRRKE